MDDKFDMCSISGFIDDVDANKDGKVSREELRDAVERFRANGFEKAPSVYCVLTITTSLMFCYYECDMCNLTSESHLL